MNKAVAYIRKSTNGVDDSGIKRQEGSYDRQRASIVDYAKRNDLDIIKWYEEPVSGKSIRKRKIFLEMIKDAKSTNRIFHHIVFGEYDRFMRHVKEGMRYEVELDDLGITLHFTNLRNDGSTADQIYKSIAREMSAEYSRELARKVLQGMYRKAKMGSWLGGVPPYGYRTVKETDGKTALVIFEKEAEAIRKIFDLSLQGHGHKRIAKWLNTSGIETSQSAKKRNSLCNKNADGRWSCEAVRSILRNPIYKGAFRWNKRARVDCFDWKVEGQGTVAIGKLRTELKSFRKNQALEAINHNTKFFIDRSKNQDNWIILENAFPAIVSKEIFDKVQERFKPYNSKSWKQHNDHKYLMSGALRCGLCENGLTGHRYGKLVKGTGEHTYYYYYRCQGDLKKGTHEIVNAPMIKQDAVDQVVIEGLKQRVQHLLDPIEVKNLLKNRIAGYFDTKPVRVDKIQSELSQVEKEIDRIIYAYTKFNRPLPEDEIRQLNSKKESLIAEKDRMFVAGEPKMRIDFDEEVENVINDMKIADKTLEEGDGQTRISLRERFLPKAIVTWYTNQPTRVDLYWRKLPGGLPQGTIPTSSTIFPPFRASVPAF